MTLEEQIEQWRRAAIDMAGQLDVALDGTIASLEGVDALLARVSAHIESRPTEEERTQTMGTVACLLGSYIGEVLRTDTPGEWRESVPGREAYAHALCRGSICAFPMFTVLRRLKWGHGPGAQELLREWRRGAVPAAAADAEAPPAESPADLAAQMAAHAQQAVVHAQKSLGRSLDFTPASLGELDAVLATLRAGAEAFPEQKARALNLASVMYGAYLGEVLRRERGGAWSQGVEGLPESLPVVVLGQEMAITFAAVRAFLEGEPVALETETVTTAQAYFEAMTRRHQARLDRILRGTAPTREALLEAVCADPALAQELVGWAQTALQTAEVRWGLRLDFSEKSLEAVEEVLGQLHDLLRTGRADQPRPSAEQVHQMAVIWGVYVGEVLRRHAGGRWTNTPLERQGAVLRLEIGTVQTFPIGKVRKRIEQGPSDAIPFYYQTTRQILSGKLR
jgi:hypothetical protein